MDINAMLHTMESTKAASRVANALTTAQPRGIATAPNATAGSAASSSTASSTTDASDLTMSDFLTLLVTEMQNQDPTQPTDPNEYIQQLVGVNSLQQLISINQELGSGTTGTSGSGSTGGATSGSSGASSITPIGSATTPAPGSIFTTQTTPQNS